MDHFTQFILPWTELTDRSALVTSMSFCEHGNEPSNSRLAKELLASEEGLCVMELVTISMPNLKITGFHSSINLQTGTYICRAHETAILFFYTVNKKQQKKNTEVALSSNFSYLTAFQDPKLNAISVGSTQNLLLILTWI